MLRGELHNTMWLQINKW